MRKTTPHASEIVWVEDRQAWKIDVLQEPGSGVITSGTFYRAMGFNGILKMQDFLDGIAGGEDNWHYDDRNFPEVSMMDAPLLFKSRDAAVKAGAAYLGNMRLQS